MANRNNNASQHNDASPATHIGPFHTYDNWLLSAAERDTNARFAARVLDISHGTKVIAQILCTHLIDLNAVIGGASDTRTLLSAADTEALARLAVCALDDLHEMATNRVDRLNAQPQQGARA